MTSAYYDALVILGFHNVGKDTLANKLVNESQAPKFFNAKFSALTKLLVSKATGCDCNDKEDRKKFVEADGKLCRVSSLDILNALFAGSKSVPELHQANVDYTLANIPSSCIPVFTDIRRSEELDAVKSHFNPCIVYLRSASVEAGESDENVLDLAMEEAHAVINCERGKVEESFQKLSKLLQDNVGWFSMSTLEYCNVLLDLNKQAIATKDILVLKGNFFFGLIEELFELEEALRTGERKNIVAEAGDVMAYVCLGLAINNYPQHEFLASDLVSVGRWIQFMLTDEKLSSSGVKTSNTTLDSFVLRFTSAAKRHFREQAGITNVLFLEAFWLVYQLLEVNRITLSEVLAFNANKLTRRASTGNLFQGSGSNR